MLIRDDIDCSVGDKRLFGCSRLTSSSANRVELQIQCLQRNDDIACSAGANATQPAAQIRYPIPDRQDFDDAAVFNIF